MKCVCGRPVAEGHDECFPCHVGTVGFALRGSATVGRGGWHTTKNDHLMEHFGTTSEKELAQRGIERKT